MTQYLTAEALIAINAFFGGGVIDRNGLEAAAYRPESGWGDVDTFPTVWDKAAAYLHGLAATQYFADGNKRTAWVAANTFLTANGHRLPRVPDIEAETFVHAVAQDVFRTDDEPNKTIAIAAEWFESKWANRRVGPAQDPRVEYVFLAMDYEPADEMRSTFNVLGAGTFGFLTTGEELTDVFPLFLPFWVVGRLHWSGDDRDADHVMTVEVVPAPRDSPVQDAVATYQLEDVFVHSGHTEHQPAGLMPLIFYMRMTPSFTGPAHCMVTVDLDGGRLAELPFNVLFVTATPDIMNYP